MDSNSISEVMQRHSEELMAITGVAGVGEGLYKGQPCIRVFVKRKNPHTLKLIPASLEGYPVCIDESEEFKARH